MCIGFVSGAGSADVKALAKLLSGVASAGVDVSVGRQVLVIQLHLVLQSTGAGAAEHCWLCLLCCIILCFRHDSAPRLHLGDLHVLRLSVSVCYENCFRPEIGLLGRISDTAQIAA